MRLVLLLAELLGVGVAWALSGRLLSEPWRGRVQNVLKAWLTVRIFWLLFAHEVTDTDGTPVPTGTLILRALKSIDATTFALFCAAAAGIKFIGILASMQRWILMLRGQRIVLPFRHVFGSFLIGRFIGTFLPSTLGLDGYTLFDAARFSGRAVEATAAKFLEKIIGPIGIFVSLLSRSMAMNSSTGFAPRSPLRRLRTETVPASISRSPITSMYGIFIN